MLYHRLAVFIASSLLQKHSRERHKGKTMTSDRRLSEQNGVLLISFYKFCAIQCYNPVQPVQQAGF